MEENSQKPKSKRKAVTSKTRAKKAVKRASRPRRKKEDVSITLSSAPHSTVLSVGENFEIERSASKSNLLEKIYSYRALIVLNVLLLAIISFFLSTKLGRLEARPILLPKTPEILVNDATSTHPRPQNIAIPSIGVYAEIHSVGKDKEGRMESPRIINQVGWYRYGAYPGEAGNSVLAGHLDDGRGNPGVFYNLRNIKIGDTINVAYASSTVSFVVRGIKAVPYDDPGDEVLREIFGETDSARLNLITCDGTWLPEVKQYSDRFVVFADKI